MATSDSSRDAAQANIVPVNPATPLTSPFDVIRHVSPDGSEYWSARELMPYLGYTNWQTFSEVIDRAQAACDNSGFPSGENFLGPTLKSTGGRPQEDFELTRHACHMVAMGGNGRKPKVAAAQTYFSIQTRRAEVYLSGSAAAPVIRPWSERLRETVTDHRRRLCMEFGPGDWTVISEIQIDMLVVEDQFIKFFLPVVSGDRMDVSAGLRWSRYRKGKPWAGQVRECPLWLPDQQKFVYPGVYEFAERFYFGEWMRNVYFPEGLPDYAGNKYPQRDHGLNAFRAVDGACLLRTGRQARLRQPVRAKLNDRSAPSLFGPDFPQLT